MSVASHRWETLHPALWYLQHIAPRQAFADSVWVCAQVDALLTGPSPPHEGKHLGKRSCTTKQTSPFPTGGGTGDIMLLGECSTCTCITLSDCPSMRNVCSASANGPPLPRQPDPQMEK